MEKKLEKLYQECIEELNRIGIDFYGKNINICISRRNNKRYGCCRPEIPDEEYKTITKKGIKYENYKKYNVEISKWVMQLNDNIIKNTIIHELIHCMPLCNNHGLHFKEYANIINEKLGYNITRLGNKKEDFAKSNIELIEKEEYNYKIQCQKCGSIFYRKRLKRNFARKYRCSKCLGKLNVIQV